MRCPPAPLCSCTCILFKCRLFCTRPTLVNAWQMILTKGSLSHSSRVARCHPSSPLLCLTTSVHRLGVIVWVRQLYDVCLHKMSCMSFKSLSLKLTSRTNSMLHHRQKKRKNNATKNCCIDLSSMHLFFRSAAFDDQKPSFWQSLRFRLKPFGRLPRSAKVLLIDFNAVVRIPNSALLCVPSVVEYYLEMYFLFVELS